MLQRGVSPAEAGVPEPIHAVSHDGGLRIERNLAVAMRDGVEILIDVYRPEEACACAGLARAREAVAASAGHTYSFHPLV